MPKQLFLAPAASGKTAFTLHLARQTAVSGQTEVRVCVPTGLQARAWQERLAAAGGALGIHVLTFDRLVAACLNEAGEAYTELSEPVQYRLLRTVIDQTPLTHYASLKAKPGFIQVVQQLITELKTARVEPAGFTEAVAQLGDEPRLRELAGLYAAYQNQLQAQQWADRVGLHWLAAEALAARAPHACRAWPLLIVDGFDDFTPTQLALLALLAERVGHFIITLTETNQADFPRYQTTRQAVEAALGISGQPLPDRDNPPAPQTALRHLVHHLFAPAAGEPFPQDGALTLCAAPDHAAEARAALRWLKQQIVWGGVAPDQAALLARDIAPYRPFIRQIAAEFGLPIRLVDGQPLAHSPAIAALLSLLRLHLPAGSDGPPDLPRRAVIAAWRSPYFLWENGETAVTSADADALDALARRQRVIGGLTQWQAAFAVAAAAQNETGSDEEERGGGGRLSTTAVLALQEKFAHFLAVTRPPVANNMRAFVQWLETLIGPDPQAAGETTLPTGSLSVVAQARRSPATAAADVAALRALKDILRGLVWAEEAVGQNRPVDYPYFLSELSGAIAAAHVFLPARPDQPEIMVANVTQARGLSFAAAAVMGLGEGSFPATLSEDPFLRDADRQALRAQFGFPLEPSTQSAEREFFYEAVSRARQNLLLTRPLLADNGAEWVASPFWEAVCRLTTARPTVVPSEAATPLVETASKAEWWETFAADSNGAVRLPEPDAAAWRQIEFSARLWHDRQTRKTVVTDGDLSSLAAALTARYGPDHIWSASRLETYQTCAFFFFTKNVLALEPRPEPAEGLDAAQLGTLYHHIFEAVMAAGLPAPLTETAAAGHVTAIAAPILDTAPEQQGFRATGWWAQTRQEIIDNVVRSVLALADGVYTFLQSEAAFGFAGPPLVIGSGEEALRLHGFIDRIDRRGDGHIRLIDYKLGGKTAFSDRAFAQGKKLQLPLYALAVQETLGLGTVADGFYWHFQQAEASPFRLEKAEGGVAGAVGTAVAHAREAVAQIRNGRFTPAPPADGCPAYCPAAGFCWHYTPKGW